ncbi:acyltransferase [Solirubrobacter sp. CPCC 204708]|uniref:Acyltransferase n=1 Tax=Solirubrobacter deserti TaxID=2282478 RepID=A0ABT4RMB8_9ACTN|nr:acyltransferase [Solirubrobacter deserti]MBE2318002.1 acyltransferase [Solirubrobacter deserti]MDA0139681.1 acyltransferase [Solirubrobacter deserti]
MVAATRAPRLDSLTGLRFGAALVVFLHHLPVGPTLDHFTKQGTAGVSFFFILSGFVLMWSHGERVGARRFYRRRFARIYPAHLVAWVIGAIIVTAKGLSWSADEFIVGAALVQDWIPEQRYYFAINGVAWSLSCEVFFYVTFPFWAHRLAALGSRARAGLAVAAVAGVVGMAAVATVVDPGADYLRTDDSVWVWFVRHAPFVRILEFLLGALLAVELLRGRRCPLGWLPALVVAGVAYVAAGVAPSAFGVAAVTLVPFALLIAAAAEADRGGAGTPFRRRWLVWLGEVSFAFYLVHLWFIDAFDLPASGHLIVSLPLAIAGAALLHHLVERPAERRIRGRNSLLVGGVPRA